MAGDNGVNVCGFITGDSGLGQSARNCINALRSVGVDVTPMGHPANKGAGSDTSVKGGNGTWHDTTIVHINPDMAGSLRHYYPFLFKEGKRVIAYWHWELEELPRAWIPAIAGYSEVWAPSRFVADAITRETGKPTKVIPHAIDVSGTANKRAFGLDPQALTFLTAFDPQSTVARKNPIGVIEAYRRMRLLRAHVGGLPRTTQLVVKCNGALPSELRLAFEGLGVMAIQGTMPRQAFLDLVASCDVYVSLHRSEGYGLPIAEAMALGKPCIATNWSGNVDFMNHANSMLVRYDLVTLDKAEPPYKKGQQWAEPSTDHACLAMKALCIDVVRERIGKSAAASMKDYTPQAVGAQWVKALGWVS